MRKAIVPGSGEEGFWFQELYRMIVVESVIGHRQLLRFSEANMPLIFFRPVLSGSTDLSKEKLAKTYMRCSTTWALIFQNLAITEHFDVVPGRQLLMLC
jgi:hypothetical protein